MKKRRNPAIMGWHERTRRAGDHGGDRTVCAVAKRAHPFGEYFVLPAGLAQRPAEGRESDPADRGSGYRAMPAALLFKLLRPIGAL